MIKFSPRIKKVSLISLFSLMLAAIIGLSVALGIVCNKNKEKWDVVTEDYAYRLTYNAYDDYTKLHIKLDIAVVKNTVQFPCTFNIAIVDTRNENIILGNAPNVTAGMGFTNCAPGLVDSSTNLITFGMVIAKNYGLAEFFFTDYPKQTFKFIDIRIINFKI